MKNRIKLMKKYFKSKSVEEKELVTQYFEEDIQSVLDRAPILLGVLEEGVSKPLIIVTPNAFYEGGNIRFKVVRVSKDEHRIDFDQALVTSIYLTTESLYYHQASINHNNGLIDFDIAGELNLFDVTHIETILDYDNPVNPRISKLILRLNLVDGSDIEFYLRHHFLHEEYQLDSLITEDEAYIIDTIKTAIRNSK